MSALGLSGLGGKTSAGFGKFRLQEKKRDRLRWRGVRSSRAWAGSLAAQKGPYLLLTTSLPEEEELEGALKDGDFRLIRRSGFVQAELSTAMKKRSQYFLSAGRFSRLLFRERCIRWATQALTRVYRYGRPLLLGVAEERAGSSAGL